MGKDQWAQKETFEPPGFGKEILKKNGRFL